MTVPDRLSVPDRMLVSLVRCWSCTRAMGGNPLPAMLRLSQGRCDCTLVPACDSYFALTEACLARPLEIADPADRHGATFPQLTADERALLIALHHCPSPGRAARMPPGIPHGLPGALCWAAHAVRRALHLRPHACAEIDHCPYRPEPASTRH